MNIRCIFAVIKQLNSVKESGFIMNRNHDLFTYLLTHSLTFYFRYSNQKSLPVPLVKGQYYYMESLMKDDHEIDHLEVGLETPNHVMYNIIPSMFLWTTLPYSFCKYPILCCNLSDDFLLYIPNILLG